MADNSLNAVVNEDDQKRAPKLTEKALDSKLHKLINVRRYKLGQLTAKSKEIDSLMQNDGSLIQIEEEHLPLFQTLLEEFSKSNDTVLEILHEDEQHVDQEYWFQPKYDFFKSILEKTETWIKEKKRKTIDDHQLDVEVSPMDSVSIASVSKKRSKGTGSKAKSVSSSSCASSSTSSASSARLKEEAKRAALLAKAATLKKKQLLELEEAQLKAKKEQLDVETAIAEATAKIKVYEDYEAPVIRDGTFESKTFTQKKEGENVHHPRLPRDLQQQPTSYDAVIQSTQHVTDVHSSELLHGNTQQSNNMEELCKVMQKQNDITELLVKQQQLSKMPPVDVPIFYGDPLHFRSFMRAFNHAIETRTENPADKLYYLEQYTRGEVRDLVRSCQHMQPHRGFQEAMKLLQIQYGNEIQIASAYMDKALQWPQIKPEDGKSLSSFSLFLTSCCNAMEDIDYLDEMDNPVNIRILTSKLPYKMREKWRAHAFELQEKSKNRAKFTDLVSFIDKQARLMTDPLFGNINPSQPAEKGEKRKTQIKSVKGDGLKKSSFATDITCKEETTIKATKTQSERATNSTAFSTPCLFCKMNHTFEMCDAFRDKPHKDKVEFLKKSGLCFSCLVRGHLSKDCKRKMSCQFCAQKHPSLLHVLRLEENKPESTSDKNEPQVSSSALASVLKENDLTGDKDSILAIVPVRIKSKKSPKMVETYAFIDPGSSGTFCTEDLARQLNLTGRKTKIFLTTMNKQSSTDSYMLTDLEVSGMEGCMFIDLPKVFTQKEIPVSKANIPLQGELDQWPYLKDVKLPCIDADVSLLIGNNAYKAMEPWKVINSQDSGPYAVRTPLGWIINGPLRDPNGACSEMEKQQQVTVNRVSLETIEELTRQQYNHDFPERNCDDKLEMSHEDNLFMEKVTSSLSSINGHYCMKLPVKHESVTMPCNKKLAEQRAINLKRKFQRNPLFHDEYKTFISNMLEMGYAVQVPNQQLNRPDGRIWYIPHHGVYHPRKKKLRVVFDCAASFQGTSLNDILLQGPDLANSLIGVLTRFRQGPIAMTADIQAMYHQVKVANEDTDLLRFLWWPEGDFTRTLEEFKMIVHPFGATSSPSCAMFALRRTAEDNQSKSSSETLETVLNNFYVDDCLKAVDTTAKAIVMVEELTALCATGGFHLTKWASNSRELLATIPEEERAKEFKDLDLSNDTLPKERTLGVQWCTESDAFTFTINVKTRPMTRRGLLSVMCKNKLGWDEEIPEEFARKWKKWLDELDLLSSFNINRCIKPPEFKSVIAAKLHHFSDASELGYGTVTYLSLKNEEGKFHSAFIIGKARVAPIKQTTIPRMELAAAVVAVKMDKMLRKEMQLDLQDSQFWTDSTTVLSYISSETHRFKTFVANRVAIIRDNTKPSQWRYVNTSLNPADCASRGLTAEDFMKNEKWINGPAFLQSLEESWPEGHESKPVDQDDVELKKKLKVNLTLTTSAPCPINQLIEYYSSWYKLKKAIAWMLRLKEILLQLSQQRQLIQKTTSNADTVKRMNEYKTKMKMNPLSVQDLQDAERAVVQYSQCQRFPEEISSLQKGVCVKRNSEIYKLDPLLIDNTLRVGGRLCNSAMPEEAVHPAILSKDMHISRLILRNIHEQSGHSGRNYVLSQLRQKYWIPKAHSAVRKLLSNCAVCRKLHGKPGEQKMSDLPQDRVLPDSPPFTNTGVDFFGPIEIKRGRSNVKRYGVLFTCLAIRAVHIEVAHSLDTDSCINAIRRFMCRRGQVMVLRSDNGTNFVGAEDNCASLLSSGTNQRLRIH
ncbi:uncharacterized protein LOC122822295 [Gambusia affinis]|uniref:uncharacterized protein LOC122822295 n=1 Tax=Gambusia affinis TaxID=33528 RepID=UPI001CDC9639|nr:uncharacterized protein LOC122822295 [Gambusia affinis]